jgi:hypothetical protein
MQYALDNWVSNSQISPATTNIDNYADNWISNSQSSPQYLYYYEGIAVANSVAIANAIAGSMANSSANSTASAGGAAQYSISSANASGNSTEIGYGSFVLNSTSVFSLDNWVSHSQLAPAFVKISKPTYRNCWVSNTQSSPQISAYTSKLSIDALFFGML